MSFISECTYIITSFILHVQRHVFKGFINIFSQDVINVIYIHIYIYIYTAISTAISIYVVGSKPQAYKTRLNGNMGS